MAEVIAVQNLKPTLLTTGKKITRSRNEQRSGGAHVKILAVEIGFVGRHPPVGQSNLAPGWIEFEDAVAIIWAGRSRVHVKRAISRGYVEIGTICGRGEI